MTKVIICGGRDFRDYELLKAECDTLLRGKKDIQIISGGQQSKDEDTGEIYGADYLGERYALANKYQLRKFLPNWKEFGRAAGPLRNAQMAEYVKVGMCIAFWNGLSAGTRSMISEAKKQGLEVHIISY